VATNKKNPMKLLHIIPTYKPADGYGGPIVSIGLLCENLAALGGCDVTVAATNANVKKDLPVHSRVPVLVDGVKVYYFRRITPDHSQLSPTLLWWLWRNVKQYDAVHIHSWWNLTVLFSTMVCILRGVKPILAPRGMLSPFSITGRFKPLFHRFIGKKLLKNTFLHATSTQEAEECLAMLPDWQNVNLPNFLDLAALPMPKKSLTPRVINNTIQLLFLSRLHQKKGIELLFNALSQVTFDWTLTMAGDGEKEYLAQLKNMSCDLGLEDKIQWLGWVNAAQRGAAFEAADLLVLPSHNENFANVVIESLACGTPVLVSQYVGLSDYVSQKKLGWVCDTTVKSLQTKLTEAYYHKGERQRISDRSPDQIRADFDPSVLVAQYKAMYRQLSPKLKIEEEKRELLELV
jgi:glycosyltransferase involved in cell wall biosynthesis